MSVIAFVNQDGQLEIIAPDGAARRRLTDDNRYYSFPSWSPDGRTLAVVRTTQGEGEIALYDREEQNARLRSLYKSGTRPPFYTCWSPDGRRLAVLASDEKGGVGLHVVPARGGPSHYLGRGESYFFAWQTSGQELFIHASGGRDARLAFLNLADLSATFEAQSIAEPGHFQTPAIAPSGRYFAYAALERDRGSRIIVEKRQGRERIALRHEGGAVMSWSPTADLLAVTSPSEPARHFYGPLRLIDPVSRKQRTLLDETVLAFFWSPDGRWLACFTVVQTGRVGQSDIVGQGYAQGRRLPEEVNFNLWLNLSVIHVASGERRLLTPFKPSSPFAHQYLPFFDQYAVSHPLWSPRSDGLVIPAVLDQTDTIVIVPLNGLPPLPLAAGHIATWSPR